MLRTFLQWSGLLAVIGIGAAGIGALAVVKDRIDVTVQPADTGNAPDPLALVRDDLQQVHADLEAIARGLDACGRAIGAEAEAAATRERALRDRVSTLASAQATETLSQRLDDLRAAISRLQVAGLAPAPAVVPAVPATEPARIDEPVAAAGDAEAAAPEEAPATPKFLSFALPSTRQSFDTAHRYRVIASLSRVGFDAKSTLHDFSGVTSKVRGELHANLADPQGRWHGSVQCTASTLRTGVDGRDENMREYLAVGEFPDISFEVTGFEPAPDSLDVAKQKVDGTVTGKMTIRGKTHDLRMPVKIAVDDSRRVTITGQAPLRLPDYDVPVPSQLGLISMEEEVVVWVALKARAAGPAEGMTEEAHRAH